MAGLEAYMRKAAALTHDVVELPPFVLYFNPHDALRFFNYAKHLQPVGGVGGNRDIGGVPPASLPIAETP